MTKQRKAHLSNPDIEKKTFKIKIAYCLCALFRICKTTVGRVVPFAFERYFSRSLPIRISEKCALGATDRVQIHERKQIGVAMAARGIYRSRGIYPGATWSSILELIVILFSPCPANWNSHGDTIV